MTVIIVYSVAKFLMHEYFLHLTSCSLAKVYHYPLESNKTLELWQKF